MRVSVYIRCSVLSPSGYYRILQYMDSLKVDYTVRNLIPFSFYKYYLCKTGRNVYYQHLLDVIAFFLIFIRGNYYLIQDNLFFPNVVILSREINPRFSVWPTIYLLERISHFSKLIWDFDDHILLAKEISKKEFDALSKCSWRIVVTNNYLKNTISKQYIEKVILLPTTDGDQRSYDLSILWKRREDTFVSSINLVWVATAANIPNLLRIMPILDITAEEMKAVLKKELVLTIVSSQKVCYLTKHLIVRNIKWTNLKAKEEMANAHIGIMPLINSEYSRGKGSFKLIQYMSTGLPIIASNVGFNKEVVSPDCGFLVDDDFSFDGWKNAILFMANDIESYSRMGRESYKHWAESFSFQFNENVWSSLLSE